MPLKGRDGVDKENTPLASEIYEDLKRQTEFLKKMIVSLTIVIGILVGGLIGTNLYHIWKWSQFDTVVVDTSGGNGNANYVQGDNTGGIYNGESGSQTPEEGEIQRDASQS